MTQMEHLIVIQMLMFSLNIILNNKLKKKKLKVK